MIIPDKKKVATVIVSRMHPDAMPHSSEKEEHAPLEHQGVLENIAQDLIHGLDIKSPKAVVSAFKAMFEALEMEPHHEFGDDEEQEEQE